MGKVPDLGDLDAAAEDRHVPKKRFQQFDIYQ